MHYCKYTFRLVCCMEKKKSVLKKLLRICSPKELTAWHMVPVELLQFSSLPNMY